MSDLVEQSRWNRTIKNKIAIVQLHFLHCLPSLDGWSRSRSLYRCLLFWRHICVCIHGLVDKRRRRVDITRIRTIRAVGLENGLTVGLVLPVMWLIITILILIGGVLTLRIVGIVVIRVVMFSWVDCIVAVRMLS